MRCKILEFNKINRNGRFYQATTEEVKDLIEELKTANRNYLTKGFNTTRSNFTVNDALSINIQDVIGKFENFEIKEEPNIESEGTLPFIEVYADFKPLNELGKVFADTYPDISFGVRGVSIKHRTDDGKHIEELKRITCLDLI